MEHAQQLHPSFPWRTATVVVGAIAAVELVVLIGIGAARLAPAHRSPAVSKATPRHASRSAVHAAPAPPPPKPHPLQARARTHVLVLNGNGVKGAAGSEAAHLQSLGYPIAGSENAPRHDYARSMVMYVPGYAREARRLGKDTGIQLVAPIDGLRPAQLKGSKLVVLLGN